MSDYHGPGDPRPQGHRYAGLVVDVIGPGRDGLLAALRRTRFSGWVGPAEGRWVVAVADNPGGSVAGSRTGVPALTGRLATGLTTLVLGVEVDDERVLRLTWASPAAVGRYDSDPTVGHEDDDDLLPDPQGVDLLPGLAAAAGRPDAADDLTELLGDQIDRDSTFESERLRTALRLLGMPTWLVASSSLPRDVPSGPRRGEATRLGAGRPGPAGRLTGMAARPVRRHRPPREP